MPCPGLPSDSSRLQLSAQRVGGSGPGCSLREGWWVTGCGLSAQVPTGCPPPPTVCCQPKLSLRRPAIEDLLLGSSANLTCTLSGLEKGQEATFTWKFSGRKNAIQGAPQPDASGCYRVSSVLPDSAEAWNSGDTFSCTATYSGATNGPLTVTITKPRGGRGPGRRAPRGAPQCAGLSPPRPPTPLGETEAQSARRAKGLSPAHPDR